MLNVKYDIIAKGLFYSVPYNYTVVIPQLVLYTGSYMVELERRKLAQVGITATRCVRALKKT